MSYKDLRKLKPEIHTGNPEAGGSPDPRFHGVQFEVPAKVYHNDKNGSDMELQKLYTHGPLKFENTGRTCGNCIEFYKDPNIPSKLGRCKAYGFKRVSEDAPADDTNDWTDPASGIWFKTWPGCPTFASRDRLSLK